MELYLVKGQENRPDLQGFVSELENKIMNTENDFFLNVCEKWTL